jgi:Icc protein
MKESTMAAAENNKTIKAAGNCLRILQITDTHLYGDVDGRLVGVNTEDSSLEVLEKALAQFWPADLILATGDIVHDGSEHGYRRFKERFERLETRTLVIPGNHDVPETLREVMQGGQVTACGHAIVGAWQFIMLDSTLLHSDGGHLAPDQLELLERSLAAHPDHHAMICLHHHPVSVQCRWIDTIGVDNADEFFAVIDRYPQVRAIVWGHIHQDYEAERNGVRLLASPSTCIQFKPRQDDFALDDVPPGFRWLKLYPDGRIETAVERAEIRQREVDLESAGYT